MRSYTHTPWPRLAENFKDEGDTLLGLLDCRLAVARNSLNLFGNLLRDTDPALSGARNPHVLYVNEGCCAPWLRITRYSFERGLLGIIDRIEIICNKIN